MSPLAAIFQALFPTTCAACGKVLVNGERHLCIDCIASLNESHETVSAEQLLAGLLPFQAALSLFRFRKGNTVQKVVHAMKFHGNSELCLMMGRQMGLELLHSGSFDERTPLPWHRRGDAARGEHHRRRTTPLHTPAKPPIQCLSRRQRRRCLPAAPSRPTGGSTCAVGRRCAHHRCHPFGLHRRPARRPRPAPQRCHFLHRPLTADGAD